MDGLCLVTVPYSHLHTPSLAVALLTASARAAGVRTEHLDVRFRFAERVGLQRYYQLCAAPPAFLLGELTFAAAAFPDFEPPFALGLNELISDTSHSLDLGGIFGSEEIVPILTAIRREARAFIEEEAERALALAPGIVGCSSSCEQHCASLALLRRIKETAPEVVTMIGGGNCDGPMGVATARAFPWVDYVVSGEADSLVAPFCRQILEHQGRIPANELPPGVLCHHSLKEDRTWQASSEVPVVQLAESTALDALPYPDYSGYFTALSQYQSSDKVFPALQLESARGCWWRQKRKGGCTFCGQNGQREQFRFKSPARLRDELTSLQERYLGRARVSVMADTILPRSYYSTLLPELKSEQAIFWMTDANIDERQMSLLAAANVRVILPGIESFHDGALRLMNKPNSAVGNVALLRLAMEHGVLVKWHFLYGIPGERSEWYEEMATWLPLISHLQPPAGGMWMLRYDRFSAYFRDPERYGLRLVPSRVYGLVYPLASEELEDLAFFFEDEQDARASICESAGVVALRQLMAAWREQFLRYDDTDRRVVLSYRRQGDQLLITDTRPCAVQRSTTLEGLPGEILTVCRSPRTAARLAAALAKRGLTGIRTTAINAAVAELKERQLVLSLNGKLLTLALREPIQPMITKREFLWGYNIDGRLV